MKTVTKFILMTFAFGSFLAQAQTYTTTYIDIKPGSSSSNPTYMERNVQDNQLYITAESSSATGIELHRHTSTTSSAPLYRDYWTGASNGYPTEKTRFGSSRLYFQAKDPSGVSGVFSSSSNTMQQEQTNANLFTECGSKLWYEGTGASEGTELFWCTTATNSAVALDFSPGSASSNIYSITNLDNSKVIVAYRESGTTDDKLIVTDGTTTTVLLEEGVGNITDISTDQIKAGNKVFFSATKSGDGEELWETDGTISGTKMVDDYRTGTGSSSPSKFLWNNGVLYFSAVGTDGDREPCKYVDNSNNVQRIVNLNGTTNSNPTAFILIGTDVYFTARNSVYEYLHKIDASQNYSLVSNFSNNVLLSTPGSFQKGAGDENGNYFFEIINDNNGNHELWVTQGTTASTQFVKTVGDIGSFQTFHKRVYFSDSYTPDGIGNELYVVYECDIAINSTIVNASCPSASDGAISLTEVNDWDYCNWDWDIDGTGDFDDDEDLTGLTPGTYKVRGRDKAGCTSQQFTLIVGVDTDVVSPVADQPTLADVTSECSASLTAPTATDNCDGAITGTSNVTFPITTQGTTLVTWTYADGNGNSSTQTQNVILNDITDPIPDNISLSDITDECSVSSITAPTASDNCSGSIVGITSTTFPITTQGTTLVTWTFTDDNGNSVTQNQNVIIDDISDPILDNVTLTDATDECSVTLVAPTATDACVGSITGTTATVFPITAQGTTIVTWTFDDGNGNVITQDQNVIIDDVTNPVTPTLANVTEDCSATLTAPTTTDACVGVVTGTTTDPLTYSTQGTYTVNWTFDDGNGNSIVAPQTIIIDDLTDPLTPTLANVTGSCSATATAPSTTDACVGNITGTTTDALTYAAQGTYTINWTFDDGQGNSIVVPQTVIVDDVTDPITDLTTLTNVTDECSVSSITAPTATDACTGAITGTTSTVFPITTQGTTVVIWTFDDGNGNIITQNQNVIIDDVTDPVPDNTTLANITDECSVASITAPSATDACAGTITGTTTTVFPITTQGTTVVTWTFDDGNGNVITQDQNVIIDDVTDPVADNATLTDVTDECSVASITAPTATDACVGTFTGVPNVTFPITTQGTTVVTWTFDDGNGNVITQNQNVIIDDVTDPVADNATLADVTDECSVASITAPTATDACVGTITGTTLTAFPITIQGTTVVTWTFDDGNGNVITQNQNVIINDVTDPVEDNATLVDVTDECSVASITAPTATDACVGTITGTTPTVFPITTQGTTVVTWTFDDGNGNVVTQDQNVIIDDVSGPIPDVTNLPDDISTCSSTPVAPSATDACVGSITGTTSTIFPITDEGTTVVTWTFDDGNGNIITQDQNIIVNPIDNTTSVSGITITATEAGVNYQWLDCNDNYSVISGETNQSFLPTINGNYAVKISTASCTDTSDCVSITTVGLEIKNQILQFIVYPNPTYGKVTVLNSSGMNSFEYTLKNVNGKVIDNRKIFNSSKFDLEIDSEPGIYMIELKSEDDQKNTFRIVKL